MTMRQITELVMRVTNRSRLLVPLPFPIATIQAKILQFLPSVPLTPDQVELLKSDNVVSAEAIAAGRTLEGLGIKPVTVEAEVPSYLWRFRRSGQFENMPA
jgi:NADH dehydrogenase